MFVEGKIELLLCVLGDLGTVDELSSVPLGLSSRAGDKAGNGSRNRQGTLPPSGSSNSLQLLLVPLSLSSGSGGKTGNGSRDGKAGNGVLGRSNRGQGSKLLLIPLSLGSRSGDKTGGSRDRQGSPFSTSSSPLGQSYVVNIAEGEVCTGSCRLRVLQLDVVGQQRVVTQGVGRTQGLQVQGRGPGNKQQ